MSTKATDWNWKVPSKSQHPTFNTIVLGLQLPNKVCLVKLARIDETGLVFTKPSENELTGIFDSLLGKESGIKIDYYTEIKLNETVREEVKKRKVKKA